MIWLLKHISEICIVAGLFMAIFVFVAWAVGYFANGLYNYHFELASCWAGIGAMGVGLVGLFKYITDSSPWNTTKGNMPNQKGDIPNEKPN